MLNLPEIVEGKRMSLDIRQASLDPACHLLIVYVGKFFYLSNFHVKWDHTRSSL